jgi:DNA-binding NarL/FixJ family response regulator
MGAIRVLLADDHPVVRSGIRALLEKAPDITVVGEASDGTEALRLVDQLKPDVLLLDMELPVLTGVEVAQRLQVARDPVRILALSAHDDEQYIFGLLSNGAVGYMTKDEALTTITDAVRGVARGEAGWLSRRITAKVLQRKVAGAESQADHSAALSARERQVLRLVAQGNPNEQIASTLCISDGTVKNHVTNIYSKLGVRTRAEAVAWAWKQGIMDDTPSAE